MAASARLPPHHASARGHNGALAIQRHRQRRSAHASLMSANQCQSVPISAYQCLSVPISAYQCQSVPISANQCQSVPVSASQWSAHASVISAPR